MIFSIIIILILQSIGMMETAYTSKSCPSQPKPAPIRDYTPVALKQSLRRIKRLLQSSISETSARCVTAGVSYKGFVLWTNGIGSIEAGSTKRPNTETAFKISGITQIYTSLLVFALLDEETLASLDDTLYKYNSKYSLLNPYSDTQVTFRQILTHMSGLPKWGVCDQPVDYVRESYCDKTTDEMLAGIRPEHYVGPAFHTPHLSNLAFAILGHFMVEITNSSSYNSLLRDKILAPMGSCKTSADIKSAPEGMAKGYTQNFREVFFNVTTGWYSPAGEMYSCVKDLCQLTELFYEAHRFGGQITTSFVSPAWRLQMGLPSFIFPDGKSVTGMPFHLRSVSGYLVRYYIGAMPGYNCVFSYIPELQVGFVSLWNGAVKYELDSLMERIYKELIPSLVSHSLTRELINKHSIDRLNRLRRYTGEYGVHNITVMRIKVLGLDLVGYGFGYEKLNLKEVREKELQISVGEISGHSCHEREARGVHGEKMLFYSVDGDHLDGFEMPGFLGAEFKIRKLE